MHNFSGKLRLSLVSERWRMKGKMGHDLTAEPQAPWKRLKRQDKIRSLTYTMPYLCACLRECTVLLHTFVGKMYGMIARCLYEREQDSESYIVSSAVKSVDTMRIMFSSSWDTSCISVD